MITLIYLNACILLTIYRGKSYGIYLLIGEKYYGAKVKDETKEAI